MSRILRFKDTHFACWSRVNLDNGDPIYISVAYRGVLVKRSRTGLLGAILFKEINVYKAARTAEKLDSEIDQYDTPSKMTNIVLKAFTQAAFEAESSAQLSVRLNRALESIEKTSLEGERKYTGA